MGIITVVLLVLFSIVCALLIFMVVIQDQEGDGLGGLFANAGNAAFGSRSSNVIVKFTYILGGLFFVIAFGLAILNKSNTNSLDRALKAKEGQSTEWWEQAPAEAEAAESGEQAAEAP
ncbi:preprotein translocase subunit SecG [Spirochaetota bacterium]